MKKLFNPLVTAIIGMFVGAMVVSAYPKTVLGEDIIENNPNFKVSEYKSDTVINFEKIKKDPIPEPTEYKVARNMITDLYNRMNSDACSTPTLFRRSYSLNFEDFNEIEKKYKLNNYVNSRNYKPGSLKFRIFPGLTADQNALTLILMIEKDGVLLRDKTPGVGRQIEIQDQMGLCPDVCPLQDDLFTEQEWQNITSKYYIPYSKPYKK
ncbi:MULTISPECIES: hypothetical protein [unclassified Arcicella]|uniref:hypothetical protein n=1 Tax=unclassified Arcicella TaxID=2644986 RepID=UPI002859821F|nr:MULTISPECIES: hypothetical protein [unclassified Arcicella]MDR6559959.1 hypothetical protein [Arcicella sp. BE51]MDR6810434.1 hypothetical protein [Arcicella sp. BE140]MDR6821784.1 hypothetical protein [Arcicella sp. BE139]